MKFAAIDIGSNAARMQISSVLYHAESISFKKVEYVRFPLRLGLEVFRNREISSAKEKDILKLLQAYKILMELHQVDDYLALATSAMREARNGTEIAEKVRKELDLRLQIISGDQESEIVNKGLLRVLDDKNYLHIDVGGGSTEVTLFSQKKVLASKSFPVGSVRLLENAVSAKDWQEMQNWVEKNIRDVVPKITAVGIGGNINKIWELARKKSKSLTIKEIEEVVQRLSKYTLEELINEWELNPDRADVITPASNVYLSVMKWAKIKEILVPGLGLKDGIMEMLAEKHKLGITTYQNISVGEW
ncbi:Ppx/GppA phosphatase family protein [Raineya orbicola]|jgi:exopolyphosphatase/guanosine-5'-triphosphate,3'-diphosphate pyrophosphatase|uniref:Ppx/GppA phosphatase family n=1 Tax=Raineya orbicola TaxID=2016530 RepID=A0A2N3IHE3_9BACT|nr:phosphatase [Raineya orbicola]PKQ69752.1 Ppx/GppA phosphatase family [Raineya orbicola]